MHKHKNGLYCTQFIFNIHKKNSIFMKKKQLNNIKLSFIHSELSQSIDYQGKIAPFHR